LLRDGIDLVAQLIQEQAPDAYQGEEHDSGADGSWIRSFVRPVTSGSSA
jgi:hypothetical protein